MGLVFPGMDPYLENPKLWPGVHTPFVVYLAEQLQPLIRPRYFAAVEERVYVERPDREIVSDVAVKRMTNSGVARTTALAEADAPVKVITQVLEIHEPYVALRDRENNRNVVTVIELVSPTNKKTGPGRESYGKKQRQVLKSTANLVEIDLLRRGRHTVAVPKWAIKDYQPFDYLININRAQGLREEHALYPIRLPQRLPRITLPLAKGEPDVVLDVQLVLARLYEAAGYDAILNYDAPCNPRLSPEDQQWANECILKYREVPQQRLST